MNAMELGNAVVFLASTSFDLAATAELMDTQVPLYALGAVMLAMASQGEQIRVRALETYALCERMRGAEESAAGLPDAETLRYVRSVLDTGSGPGPEPDSGAGAVR